MDRKNFKDQIFDTLPEAILCSNFKNCTFNASTHFERCNLITCIFNAECTFDRSNIIDEEELKRFEAIPEEDIVEEVKVTTKTRKSKKESK